MAQTTTSEAPYAPGPWRTVSLPSPCSEILADFLVRPLTTCRSLAVLWGNLSELQDEITRVRRSADEKVGGWVGGQAAPHRAQLRGNEGRPVQAGRRKTMPFLFSTACHGFLHVLLHCIPNPGTHAACLPRCAAVQALAFSACSSVHVCLAVQLQYESSLACAAPAAQVLYVRIRPPHAAASPPPTAALSGRREALLDALSSRLYAIEQMQRRVQLATWSRCTGRELRGSLCVLHCAHSTMQHTAQHGVARQPHRIGLLLGVVLQCTTCNRAYPDTCMRCRCLLALPPALTTAPPHTLLPLTACSGEQPPTLSWADPRLTLDHSPPAAGPLPGLRVSGPQPRCCRNAPQPCAWGLSMPRRSACQGM